MSGDKRVVVYPCRDSTLLNFVCIHQAEQKGEATEGGIPEVKYYYKYWWFAHL
jgi:hypothetical protein